MVPVNEKRDYVRGNTFGGLKHMMTGSARRGVHCSGQNGYVARWLETELKSSRWNLARKGVGEKRMARGGRQGDAKSFRLATYSRGRRDRERKGAVVSVMLRSGDAWAWAAERTGE